jgi:hypothetical protein
MALTATLVKRHQSGLGLVAKFSIAAAGTYTTGGMTLDFAPVVGYTNRQPDFALINGLAGYVYKYDLTNKTVWIYQAGQPSGTIAAPTFTGTSVTPVFTGTAVVPSFKVKAGTIGSSMDLGLTADTAAADFVGGTGITTDHTLTTTSPVQSITPAGVVGAITPAGTISAPAFTGGAAAALAELPASTLPVGVSGDTIVALVFWIPTPSLNA